MASKCRGIAEVVAVMEMAEVGVRTRARAAMAMGVAATSAKKTPKRKKINDEELKFPASSSSLVQLKGRSRADFIQPEEKGRCSSPTSDELTVSSCSSKGSTGLDEERIEFVDLEIDSAQAETSTCNCRDERREMRRSSELRPNSEDVEPTEANTRRIATVQMMPSELELEEFFAAAEKDIQTRFEEKYNYDIVKDMPLKGRYEWVQIKP